MKSPKSNKPTENKPDTPPSKPAASKPISAAAPADAGASLATPSAAPTPSTPTSTSHKSGVATDAPTAPAAKPATKPRAPRVRKVAASSTPEFSFATEIPPGLATATNRISATTAASAPSRIPALAPAKPQQPLTISTLIATPSDLTDTSTSTSPVVMMTRIRLARNLAGHRFPGFADETRLATALATCRAALAAAPALHPAYDLAIAALTDLEKQILVERHLISRELAARKNNAAAMISQDQTCSIMINEEDHLRIQFLHAGFQLEKTWAAINAFDTALEDTLEYAFSPTLGYLTACPTNLGTALRASAMMHLPALGMCGLMEKINRAVNQLGIVVRGQFGEGSDATGSIFQISNQTTLGETEEQIIRRLSSVLASIVEHELNARARLLEKDPARLHDKIGRAYGILQNARLLTSGEAMNLLSLARLGADLDIFPAAARSTIDRLFIEAQPGHIQYAAQKTELDPAHRDTARATLVRDALAAVPDPDFTSTNTPTADKHSN